MIKKWIQFIKESNHYWLKEKDIQDSFVSLKDEGYKIRIKKYLFTDKNKEIISLDPFLTIYSTNNKYYLGYKIIIENSLDKNSEDITLDFKGSINHLKDEGFILHKIAFQGYSSEEEEIFIDNLYLSKGNIISWIPKKSGKSFYDDYEPSDIYKSSKYLFVYIYQPEKSEIYQTDIAEIYDWSQYSTDGDGNIYLELDIEELAELVLSKTTYLDELVNGIDPHNWFTNETDVLYSFNYEINDENKILSIKSIIKEIGGINIFINECNRILDENGYNDNLNGKSEEELISIFMKFNLTNPKYKCLQSIIKNSEIISEIVEVISDFEIQSKTENIQLELENEFDKILKEENIEFTKYLKKGKKYFYRKIEKTSRKEKVYYDDDIWFYKLKFQERWIVDLKDGETKGTVGESLQTIFVEWCENKYFNNELNPNFSDYASVDEKLLDSEIENILKKFLK